MRIQRRFKILACCADDDRRGLNAPYLQRDPKDAKKAVLVSTDTRCLAVVPVEANLDGDPDFPADVEGSIAPAPLKAALSGVSYPDEFVEIETRENAASFRDTAKGTIVTGDKPVARFPEYWDAIVPPFAESNAAGKTRVVLKINPEYLISIIKAIGWDKRDPEKQQDSMGCAASVRIQIETDDKGRCSVPIRIDYQEKGSYGVLMPINM